MNNLGAIIRRELQSYFMTPLASIFIAVFLGLVGLFTFNVPPQLYEAGQANLAPFFNWHPWLYLFLVPAISMRVWAEERRQGTIELLLTLPVSIGQAVTAKFLAGWLLLAVALVLTFPVVVTVCVLGDPDLGQILAGYVGSLLVAGGFLAIGCCISAACKNQVVAFVISAVVCFLFLLSSLPPVLDFFSRGPEWLIDGVEALSFWTHFESVKRGVIELTDLVFFSSMILVWLYACSVGDRIQEGAVGPRSRTGDREKTSVCGRPDL